MVVDLVSLWESWKWDINTYNVFSSAVLEFGKALKWSFLSQLRNFVHFQPLQIYFHEWCKSYRIEIVANITIVLASAHLRYRISMSQNHYSDWLHGFRMCRLVSRTLLVTGLIADQPRSFVFNGHFFNYRGQLGIAYFDACHTIYNWKNGHLQTKLSVNDCGSARRILKPKSRICPS